MGLSLAEQKEITRIHTEEFKTLMNEGTPLMQIGSIDVVIKTLRDLKKILQEEYTEALL
jgi:hypothetical protein